MTPPVLNPALAGAIDYAGLYPPSALPLDQALAAYAAYAASPDAWVLGRFLCPASRLDSLPPGLIRDWRLAATAGPDVDADAAAIDRVPQVDTVEFVVSHPADVARRAQAHFGHTLYGEVALDAAMEAKLDALAAAGLRAKVRCGGLQPATVPASPPLAAFIAACRRRLLPFKATAGLHHALRGDRSLDESPAGPRADLHGFLNLLRACAHDSPADILAALEDNDAACTITAAEVSSARWLFSGWGSCSFDIPLRELHALALI